MAGLSRYAAQALFDRTLNPSTRTSPVFLALHKASVNDETYGYEADYAGYAREPLNSMYAVVSPSLDGEVVLLAKNGARIQFTTSGGPINTITHWAIWDNATIGDGNVLYSGPLSVTKVIETGNMLVVRPDELVIGII